MAMLVILSKNLNSLVFSSELDPAILQQPLYGVNAKRCNIVKKAVRQSQGYAQTVLIQFSFQHRSVDLAMRLHGCDDHGGQAFVK